MNLLTSVKRPNSIDSVKGVIARSAVQRSRRRRGNLLIFYFIFLIISPAYAATSQVCLKDNCVSVEVVYKNEDMERGLMYRTSMDQNKGMLFLFTGDDKEQFWMKNMHFNLDILWISSDGHIVYIGQDIPACAADPCPVYTPTEPARYVLELNAGYTMTHQWKLGDKLDLKGVFKK